METMLAIDFCSCLKSEYMISAWLCPQFGQLEKTRLDYFFSARIVWAKAECLSKLRMLRLCGVVDSLRFINLGSNGINLYNFAIQG